MLFYDFESVWCKVCIVAIPQKLKYWKCSMSILINSSVCFKFSSFLSEQNSPMKDNVPELDFAC